MTEAEKILKQALSNNPTTSDDVGSMNAFRNSSMSDVNWHPDNALFKTIDKGVNTASKNLFTSTALMLAAGLILKNGRFMRNAASNMRNFVPGYYASGIGTGGKVGLLAKEGVKGTLKGTRKLRDVNIDLAKSTVGLEPAIKQSVDELIGAKQLILSNPSNWVKGNMSGKLIDTARQSITTLDKKLSGEMNNAFALMVRKEGIKKAMQSPLYQVIKPLASYKQYGKASGKGAFNKLGKDMGIKDYEVLNTGLGAWGMNLKGALKAGKLNVANFKINQLQNPVQDIMMSNQGKLAFLAHEKGLIGKGVPIKKLQDYFVSNGFKAQGNNIFSRGKKGNELKVLIKKTAKGTTHIQFSPSRKGNYHWGGFNGNLVFNNSYKGKVGVFGTDVYDVPLDKLGSLRPTPLLNVSNVKYTKVPIIKSKKPPVYTDKVKGNSYNGKVREKIVPELEEVKTKTYGIKETKEYSQDVEKYFGLLSKPVKNRAGLRQYTGHSKDFNNAVKDYYRLYTKVTMGKANPQQLKDFRSAKLVLGLDVIKGPAAPAIAGATALGAYSMLRKDED